MCMVFACFSIISSLARAHIRTPPLFCAVLRLLGRNPGGSGGADKQASRGRSRGRPAARYGSKLWRREPERLERMRAVLGYSESSGSGSGRAPPKVESVTISTLQTMKYLYHEDKRHLRGIASYKVTSLNRQLAPLLEATQQQLDERGVGDRGGRAPPR